MANSSETPKISVRILADKAKNKIVFVEAGKEFVDVLFSFLKLKMGTIVRLVNEKTAVGCFSNIYKSVLDMNTDIFLTEACKHMLLYPTSLNDDIFSRLKLNIHDTLEEAGKHFICPGYKNLSLCSEMWSSFSSSKCICGRKMEMVIERDYDDDGVFVHGQPSLFVITDDMVVQSSSPDVFIKVFKDQGYQNVEHLTDSVHLIGSEEVLALLECLFSSETPLTDAFLLKQRSRNMNMVHKTLLSPTVQESGLLSFKVAVGKQNRRIVFIECKEDFVNLLLNFLAVSLEFVLESCGGERCLVNLFRSYKDLSFCERKTAETLPWYYSCQKELIDINIDKPPRLMFVVSKCGEVRLVPWSEWYCARRVQNVNPMNPRCKHSDHQSIDCDACKGFVKGDITFRVSDDLIITPMSSSSNIGCLEDVYVQEMSIGKTEVKSVLTSCLMTSTVFTTALLTGSS